MSIIGALIQSPLQKITIAVFILMLAGIGINGAVQYHKAKTKYYQPRFDEGLKTGWNLCDAFYKDKIAKMPKYSLPVSNKTLSSTYVQLQNALKVIANIRQAQDRNLAKEDSIRVLTDENGIKYILYKGDRYNREYVAQFDSTFIDSLATENLQISLNTSKAEFELYRNLLLRHDKETNTISQLAEIPITTNNNKIETKKDWTLTGIGFVGGLVSGWFAHEKIKH